MIQSIQMKNVIPEVNKALIIKELTRNKFVRDTNYGNRDIFIVNNQDSPNILREIGRLREISFRDSGGGTGNELDLDEYDLAPNSFEQLIVWDPKDQEIIGGYRFIKCSDLKRLPTGELDSPTSHLFKLSDFFIENYVPHTIELGRSFIRPEYQATFDVRKGMFSLDNIWDGLGALIFINPQIKYFFGKMTMYSGYDKEARNYLLAFLYRHFPDPDKMALPKYPVIDVSMLEKYNTPFTCSTFSDDYKILNKILRDYKENIPPLVNAYMNLSPSMRFFGTAQNEDFGHTEESGILVTINDMYEKKVARHISLFNHKIKIGQPIVKRIKEIVQTNNLKK
ncbi:MAG: GNAT family N-acetyltransferase [Bacteroidales bacterium]|nr:GNAT family N-acetyltransferase [Bacteroidales bacterium]